MAELAVRLHMAPADLLACDDEVLEALVPLAERARTEELWALEVLALQAELVHAHWRLTLQANIKKGARLPPPLSIPRPWAEPSSPRGPASSGRRVSVQQLMAITGPRG